MISDGNRTTEVKVHKNSILFSVITNICIRIMNLFVKIIYIINMKILYIKDLLKKYNLKNDTMIESELQRNYNYKLYPRVSKINSDKGFVNIDNGSMRGTHWCAFYVKINRSFYFDSFRGEPDKFLLKQLPKLINHKYKIQDINSKLCGSFCLYFLNLIERMNYYDTILKLCFEKV